MRRPPLGRLGLPVLPNIYVATPCPADWSKMTGDERVRMCGQCNKHVFNLSNMLRSEAEEIIVEKNGSLCVRYYQRKDGTILLKDCTVAAGVVRRRHILGAAAAALLATGGGAAALVLNRPSTPAQASRVMAPPPPAEIEFRVREQAFAKEPPPPVVEVPQPPPEEPVLDNEWHVTGGAVAIEPEYELIMGQR